jgi:hypothetical protein
MFHTNNKLKFNLNFLHLHQNKNLLRNFFPIFLRSKMTFSSITRKRQKKDSTLHESMPMALAQKTQTLSSKDRSFFSEGNTRGANKEKETERQEMQEMGFGVKKDVTISGRGEEEEGGNPNLGLGFTSDIQLLDAKGKNTSNVNTTAPWDTVTTRTDHGLELSKSLLHGNSGLIYLVQTTHLTHFFIFFLRFLGGRRLGGWMGFVSLPLQNFSYSAAATTTPTQNLQPNLQTLTTHNIILSTLEIITPKPKSTNSCTPQRVNNSPSTHISQNLQIHKIILNT